MKKVVIFILFVLVVVLALWTMKASIMSTYLSKILKTPVSIGSIDFSKSQITIKDLKIKNPSGFKEFTAYSCKEVIISFDLKKIKNDPSIIDRIDMNDNYLYIDCQNALCTDNNWTKIMKNISDRELKGQEREVVISSLTMNDLKVNIQGVGLIPGSKDVNIDHIEFTNVSSKEGFPTEQLIIAIFQEAKLFDYIKGIIEGNKIFDKYFKSFNPFGANEVEN